ncbi:MAG: AAA family ATPase, partial [Thermomicrobiales bacterium]
DADPDGLPVVTAHLVAAAIANRTGIPIDHLTRQAGDGPPALDIEAQLRDAVVGQEAAVAAVAATVRLSRLGLRPEERPRGIFLFGGPTGVGTTALARALANAMTGSEASLLRIDLSEYQEAHSVSRLIGSPPGYVGYGDGGQLTKWLQRQPASVVLLDEFEKAHPRVLDLFLQVFDAGRITDGQGQTVDARHAWFIMTTNLPVEDDLAEIKAAMRPEFLNRIDHVVRFDPLGLPQLLAIAEREIDVLRRRLGPRVHALRVEPLAMLAICQDDAGGRAANGRTVLRNVESEITHPLAVLLASHAGNPPVVNVDPLGGGVSVTLAEGPEVAHLAPPPAFMPGAPLPHPADTSSPDDEAYLHPYSDLEPDDSFDPDHFSPFEPDDEQPLF